MPSGSSPTSTSCSPWLRRSFSSASGACSGRWTRRDRPDDRVGDTVRRVPVDLSDDLPCDPASLFRELVRVRECAPDSVDDLFEPLGFVERGGLRELAVVLPDDVLERPALSGRTALV